MMQFSADRVIFVLMKGRLYGLVGSLMGQDRRDVGAPSSLHSSSEWKVYSVEGVV